MSEEKKYILAEADYIAGMKYKDIATKYKVSLNTVKSWKKRYGWERKKGAHKNEKGCTQNIDKKTAVAEEVEQVMKNDGLNDKQRLFCVLYVKCFNSTKAYKKAYQCSYETALTNGPALLGNTRIKKEIQRLKQNRLNREMLDESDIFQRYMDIAFADITDYVEFGQEEVEIFDKNGIGRMVKVSVVHVKNDNEVDGTLLSEISKGKDGVKVKLLDKMKAMQWLSDHMDMATERQRAEIEQMRVKTEQMRGADQNPVEDKVMKLFDTIGGVLDAGAE